MQADIPLRSALSGHPRVSELVVDKPVLYVPLRRERDTRIDNSPKPALHAAATNDFNIDRVKVIDGAVAFANLPDSSSKRMSKVRTATSSAERPHTFRAFGRGWLSSPESICGAMLHAISIFITSAITASISWQPATT